MSVRDSDYGMNKEEYKKICQYCQSEGFNQHDLLQECAMDSNSSIADYLVESIEYALSYERMSGRHYIPINKYDFYAYRRKCIALFAERIRL